MKRYSTGLAAGMGHEEKSIFLSFKKSAQGPFAFFRNSDSSSDSAQCIEKTRFFDLRNSLIFLRSKGEDVWGAWPARDR